MKHVSTRRLSAAVLAGIILVASPSAPAAKHSGEDAALASDRLLEAQKAKEAADKAFDDVTNKLLGGMDHDSKYSATLADANSAQAVYDTLNVSAVAALQNDAAYKSEVAARDQAKQTLEHARLTGQASDEEKTTMAKEVMSHNTAIHKMEANASKNVPGLAQAKSKAMSAQARLAQIKAGYMRQVSQDPKWIAAKAAMDQTHQEVTQAEIAVAKIPDHTRGPIAANPRYIQPANIQPQVIQPKVVQPKDVQPVVAQPVAANPIAKDPVTANPVAKGPAVIQPVAKEPANIQPVAKDPVVAQPKAANPVPANPVPSGPPNN